MNAPLRGAIVHYHLKRGGVTRVIESTLRGLGQGPGASVHSVVLTGEIPDGFPFKESARAVEGLHYSNSQARTPDSASLLQRMRDAARQALGAEPDLWHIHNHSLGKNEAMPGVVSLLAEAGEALLLQIHDFAEDGRPQNHRVNQARTEHAGNLYPLGDRVHYALINARDHAVFTSHNLPGAQQHLLANPVEVDHSPGEPESTAAIRTALRAETLFLYPVRALRRKNLGEFLLWSALARPGEVFATTLGPTNPDYQQTYRDWQSLAQSHQLPVHFGIGESMEHPFPSIMQSADCILTTSIAEGFGLSFLEPWLYGKPVTGRDLPEITADFKQQGIDLGPLYPSLPVPDCWIEEDALHAAIGKHLDQAYADYGRALPADAIDRAIAAIRPTEDTYDFGGLDEARQGAVIERLASNPLARQELPCNNLTIPEPGEQARQIRDAYSLEAFSHGLQTLYRKIAGTSASAIDYLPPGDILDSFLMPERFRLLRT